MIKAEKLNEETTQVIIEGTGKQVLLEFGQLAKGILEDLKDKSVLHDIIDFAWVQTLCKED